jgi:halorhodopsin
MTQTEIFQYIQDNTLLSASLWVNIALAGFSILLFVYMGRKVEDPRAQLIFVAAMMVPLVSISSYTGLVSGITVGFLEMPAGHALEGMGDGPNGGVFTPWGRYLTWAFSTPMILAALGLLAGTDTAKLFTAVAADVGMCVTGLAAALTTSSLLLRWVWFGISCAFFVVVLYILLAEWARDAEVAGTAEIFNTLKILTVVLWLGYPIVWGIGAEGLALIQSPAITSWAYSAMDIVAKYLFAFLLLRWVVNNERTVADMASGLGAASRGGAAPADD